jgi:TPR repeat protein
MNENDFWHLIETARAECKGDGGKQVALIQEKLQTLSDREILDFDRLLHEQMRASYNRDLWAAAYIINGGCSDDGFDYFRAWLIAQGKEVFYRALKDPESLVEAAGPDTELELFFYTASKAYEAKTGKEFPCPSRPPLELTGDEWEEDEAQLQKKYPGLFAKFWKSGETGPKAVGGMDLKGVLAALQRRIGGEASAASDPQALYTQAALLALDETPENLTKSAALLTRAADQGHAGAQYLLGACYQNGQGVPQNFSEAIKRYRQAAAQGNADACGALGSLYDAGQEVDQDFDEAFKWYQKGAEAGSADAEFGLGVLYSNGHGVEKNLPESLKWYRRAAQDGHITAANNVGVIYSHGKGVEIDHAEAARWFSLAGMAGSAKGQYSLGVLYENGRGVPQDFTRAARLYQAAADQGHAQAQSNLGRLYGNGTGVPQDDQKAAQLYRQAAEAGNLTAMSNLAVLYQNGRGVPQDHAEALRLYRKCAEAGSAVGQFNLGTMYHHGLGVPKDDQEALRWYQLAAAQGHPSAENNIGDAYENGYGAQQDYTEAAKWYRKAAEHGVPASHYSLGIFYRDGLGVKQDYQEAEIWLKRAVEKGFEKARPHLEALYEAGLVKRPQPETRETKPPPPKTTPESGKSDTTSKIVTPQAAARRVLCLRALLHRLQIEAMFTAARENPKVADKTNLPGLQTEVRQINEWLKDETLWLAASDAEKKWLNSPAGSWAGQMLKNVCWRAEALGVIGWSLGLADRIPPYDAQLDESSFAYHLKILCPAKPFVSGAKLRDEKEILQAREIAESWLWRARTTQIQKEPGKYPPPPLPPGWTYDKIILQASTYWEKEGLFKGINGDYPAHGKAYRELTDGEWHEMRSIATERLYGLNWLCGYAADWDRVPTGT